MVDRNFKVSNGCYLHTVYQVYSHQQHHVGWSVSPTQHLKMRATGKQLLMSAGTIQHRERHPVNQIVGGTTVYFRLKSFPVFRKQS